MDRAGGARLLRSSVERAAARARLGLPVPGSVQQEQPGEVAGLAAAGQRAHLHRGPMFSLSSPTWGEVVAPPPRGAGTHLRRGGACQVDGAEVEVEGDLRPVAHPAAGPVVAYHALLWGILLSDVSV